MFRIVGIIFALFLIIPSWAEAAAEQILINKGTNQLAFYQDNQLVKVFSVATGRSPALTPEGNFYIINKIINPPYYKKKIPGGSPHNPLGPRWLGLSAPGGAYGIHGNSNPHSIGTYASDGCIRLHNRDITWLYEQVPIGTPVKIINNNSDLQQLKEPETAILTINGNYIPENCRAIILEEQVLVALRPLAEYFGYHVTWDHSTNQVIISGLESNAVLQVPSTTVTINGQAKELSMPPYIWQNTTYVPLDFFKEVFGIETSWDPQQKHANLWHKIVYLPII